MQLASSPNDSTLVLTFWERDGAQSLPIAAENNMFQCDRVVVHVESLNFYCFFFLLHFFFYLFILEILLLRIRMLFQSLFSAKTCHKSNSAVYDGLSPVPQRMSTLTHVFHMGH